MPKQNKTREDDYRAKSMPTPEQIIELCKEVLANRKPPRRGRKRDEPGGIREINCRDLYLPPTFEVE